MSGIAQGRVIPRVGGSFASVVSVAGAFTIVSAASNVRGLILRSIVYRPATGQASVYYATSAPTGLQDTARAMLVSTLGGTIQFLPPLGLFIPAGNGIFAYDSAAGNLVCVTYDLL